VAVSKTNLQLLEEGEDVADDDVDVEGVEEDRGVEEEGVEGFGVEILGVVEEGRIGAGLVDEEGLGVAGRVVEVGKVA